MHHPSYTAFEARLRKISSFNPQQIRQQGAQMVQQGQAMMQNPLGAVSQIRQNAFLAANNPATRPHTATHMASLLQATRPSLSKTASVQIHAFIDELECTYGYEFDEQTKEAMFGAAAKLIGQGMSASANMARTVAANPRLAMNNATMRVMTSPGMNTLVHNPALATAVMGQQLAGGMGQALLGKGLVGAAQAGARHIPGAAGQTVGAFTSALGHVV